MTAPRLLLLARSLLALSAWALSACGPSIPATVKIGVAQPLSGPSAARGQDLLNGVKLAADELNAAGYKIAGKAVRIEIVAMDDKADKAEAKKVAQALVAQKVIAVIGHLSSDVTEAVIPIYKSGNVPQLFTSSAAELTKQGAGNTFRLVASDVLQARAIASYMADALNSNNTAIVYEDTAFGAPMAKDVTAALNAANKKVTLAEPVNNQTTDFTAFVAKLKASPPDAVLAAVRDHQLLPLFAQMGAAGLADLPVMVTSVAKTQKLLAGATGMKRVFATSGTLEPKEFTSAGDFSRRFGAAYKTDPVWAAHYAYDAMYVLADTMRRLSSADPNALRAGLSTIDAMGPVTQLMRFNADGELRYGAIGVYQKRDTHWQPLMRSDRW
jgi:branched-chain amino acid transport system substrate-binding protein